MKLLAQCKKIWQKTEFIRHIRFTQTMVLAWGMIIVTVCLIIILIQDTVFFMQSISPPRPQATGTSKQISLTSQDIDDAIHILDQRQQQFNTLIQGFTGTTTISF